MSDENARFGQVSRERRQIFELIERREADAAKAARRLHPERAGDALLYLPPAGTAG